MSFQDNDNDSNNNNKLIQSKIILQKIISLSIGSLDLESDFRLCVDDVCYQTRIKKPIKLVLNYVLVCKEWFNIISKTIATDYLFKDSRYNKQEQSQLLKKSIDYLSKSQSVFQLSTIKNLYLLDRVQIEIDKDSNICEYLLKFSNLERLSIFTNNMKLIKDIIRLKPSLRIHLYIDNFIFYVDYTEIESLDQDYSQLEQVIMTTSDLAADGSYDRGYKFDFSPIKRWRVNTLYFEYDGGGHSSGALHIPYSKLFKIDSLISITICDEDYVDIKELKLIVNDHIESFKASSILSLFGKDENDDIGYCSCTYGSEDDHTEMIANNNQTGEWLEFCQRLSNNKSLKTLSLSNFCSNHKISDESTFKLVSQSFSQSLLVNTTLSNLEISCDILGESFYSLLSHNNNTTINKLILLNLNEQHLMWTLDMLKSNKHIRKLDIESYTDKIDWGYKENEQMKELIKEFITTFNSISSKCHKIIVHTSGQKITYDFFNDLLNDKENLELCQKHWNTEGYKLTIKRKI
ncbi:hypothetical protein PPL_08907 [Heterostelium album PN500]|uniref:Uncharacterized protein n=1 Tax=Heterostelium pallidum (strain ATCC 26659 / Pp 5 / PN500) TaxID=670386 RepID=D3BK26_HETP5|nr:hypothetical protein PPL_08907 [Heterostelium album PN500]EFA78256.1 hypothetical protein PPL_08907 [Heterostelium album PN500]|eukprot:XP_020430381.1 hypothetical protein PPL_08907 [Heterostelium album PN500]